MRLSVKIKTFLCLLLMFSGDYAYASSYSSNFSVNDEAVDFAHNTDYLESSSFKMDLSGVFWTDRPSESASFKIIDANSDLIAVTPPTPGGGGGGGSVAGGRPDYNPGETDSAYIDGLPEEEAAPDLDLHGAAEEEPVTPEYPVYPVYSPVENVEIETSNDDLDGCSASFEMRYMDTNPYIYDTDDDGVGDCDEDWVYGLNPVLYDENFLNAGIANADEFVYTQENPLFVGRADFGNEHFYETIQMELNLIDPFTELGMFFMNIEKDLNFIGKSEQDLLSGVYSSNIYVNGNKQENPDKFSVDSNMKYETLEIYVPDGGKLKSENGYVYIEGKSGSEYGILAMWVGNDYIDVSAVVADENGVYDIPSPVELKDGVYSVYVYSIYRNEDKFVQTNYHNLSIKVDEGVPYILAEASEKERPILNVKNDFVSEKLYLAAEKDDSSYLIPYLFLSAIIFTTCLLLWKIKN